MFTLRLRARHCSVDPPKVIGHENERFRQMLAVERPAIDPGVAHFLRRQIRLESERSISV